MHVFGEILHTFKTTWVFEPACRNYAIQARIEELRNEVVDFPKVFQNCHRWKVVGVVGEDRGLAGWKWENEYIH